MAVVATVREWSDEGWGVLDSDQTPGGCWAHFSNAAVAGYVSFTAGQPVWLEWESPGQDGYAYRAVRFWPQDKEPEARVPNAGKGAYHSELTLTFDNSPDHA
jgi:CspA family cold shock protein